MNAMNSCHSCRWGRSCLWTAAAVLLLAGLSIRPAGADNVDLSTVPSRATVQLTIYNSEDITLVRETRAISFKKGVNPLQFSWAGTLIDPSSVELRFVSSADKLEVLDTTFPHDKPQMLYWNVQSEFDGEATVEIKYFTSGITWTADYVCIANTAEEQMGFEGFVRVHNNSGEEYENAQIRLVVGTINLVEKIAQLAQVPISTVTNMPADRVSGLRREAASMAMGRGGGQPAGAAAPAEKEIIKEGLSEYFIYTIDGTESIANGWSKRMRSFQGQTVPFRIEYRYRPEQYGDQLVRMYLLANDEDSHLGTTPLPDGMVRVFRDNGRDGLSYLTAQPTKYVPIGDKIELNLGADPQVIFELIPLRTWRDEFWVQVAGTTIFKRVDDGKMEVVENSSVAGWDDHVLFNQRVRNYTAKPITLEIRRAFGGHAVLRSSLEGKNHDYRTLEYRANLKARSKVDLLYELVTKQGHNHTQDQLTLENAKVER